MSNPTVTAYAIPTGGVISLTFSGAVSGAAMLERAVSGEAFTTIYSGFAQAGYIDTGEPLPGPLNANSLYQYRYTDIGGTTTTQFIQPVSILAVQPEPITELLVRVLQGAFNSMQLPTGVKLAQVTHAMPLGGNIPLPFVVVNLELMQQAAVPIGQSIASLSTAISGPSGSYGQSITGFARRVYRVSALCDNAPARDFYRDTIVGIFEAIYGPILQPLGIDVTHKWQVSTGQVAVDRVGKAPGFYYADVVMEFEGTLNVTLVPTAGYIERITTTAYFPGGSAEIITVPLGS